LVDAVRLAIDNELSARRRTNELLQLRPEAWCGKPFEDAQIAHLLQKANKAADSPDDLEKQIALLSTEEEATQLGLGDLIAVWNHFSL
jgi:hypothetical protein